ncbi:MAG: RNA polymerase subunit sigma [Armatimonadetes bacterium]|nr:RNA polymerase subunit sigma [Armatimonadota bacterium]
MEELITWDELEPFMAEVRVMARDLLRQEWQAESLQTTALVLTALRRLRRAEQDWSEVTWQNRHYFFGAVYTAMGRALIDHGRRRMAKKRAVSVVRLEDLQLHDLPRTVEEAPEQVVALVETLEQLKEEQPEWAEVVEHRYFGGLTSTDTARALGVSKATVDRRWGKARVFLHVEILRRLNAA